MRIDALNLDGPSVHFAPLRLSVAILAALLGTAAYADEPMKFDASFMQSFGGTGAGPNLDLDAIANSGSIGPGTYPVLIRLNQSFFDRRDMTFIKDEQSGEVRACLSEAFLTELGVKLEAFQVPGETLPDCVDLATLVDGASVSFDANYLALDISVPQIALRRDAAGYVAPQDWDRGINASMLNYQFSASQTQSDARGSTSQYNLYANGGFNLGDWRFRTSTSFLQDEEGRRDWQRSNTYAQRDVTALKGTLTVGESFTPGDVFDSVPFRGVQLASDMGMLPDSMQGYAPIIRGIAETQAKVEVRQNGYSLYTTYVAPGAFEINDLNAASGSGDLEVVITEADGRERRFTQPYATLGNILREKTWRYSMTVGEYNAVDGGQRPAFAQASLAYGLPFDLTLYGGLLGADFYRAGVVGMGKSLGSLGAVSLDITGAQTDVPQAQGSEKGHSVSVRYGKAFESGTSVRFAGYRYSTEGYRDFDEAVRLQAPDDDYDLSRRSKVEASVNQALDRYGSFYLNMSQQNYWGSSRQDKQMQVGFNTQFKGVTYGVYASKTLTDTYGQSNQVVLTVSMPLGQTRSTGTYAVTRNTDGSLDQRAGLSGRDGEVTYNVNANRSENAGNNGSALLGYRAPFAQLGAGVSVGSGYRQTSLSAAGSVLAHGDGVEFGQTLGETVALVEIKDTPNVGVLNAPGTLTNKQGYALVPYVMPYRKNRVALDTGELDTDIDIEDGVTNVVPRRGAVVKATFAASRSEKVVLNVRLQDGGLPPFGTSVLDAKGISVGVVGQAGQVLMAVGESKVFNMKWGDKAAQSCTFELDISKTAPVDGYRVMEAICSIP